MTTNAQTYFAPVRQEQNATTVQIYSVGDAARKRIGARPPMKRRASYQTSPLKRRRTGAEMDGLFAAIITILDGEADAITIRHLF